MITLTAAYAGHRECEVKHPVGLVLRTHSAKDPGAAPAAFSPTELIAAGLATCILTTLGMYAERHNLDLGSVSATVGKEMSRPPSPGRIASLPVTVTLPASIPVEMRERLERAGRACPVHATLHPDVHAPIEYRYV